MMYPHRPSLQDLRASYRKSQGEVLDPDMVEVLEGFDDEMLSLAAALYDLGYHETRSLYAQWHEMPLHMVHALAQTTPLGGDE